MVQSVRYLKEESTRLTPPFQLSLLAAKTETCQKWTRNLSCIKRNFNYNKALSVLWRTHQKQSTHWQLKEPYIRCKVRNHIFKTLNNSWPRCTQVLKRLCSPTTTATYSPVWAKVRSGYLVLPTRVSYCVSSWSLKWKVYKMQIV